MTTTDTAIAFQLFNQTESHTRPNWMRIALVAVSTTLPMVLVHRAYDAYGVTIEQRIGSSGQVATLQTEPTAASVVRALESLAGYLRASQADLDAADKEILYGNLWELYD